tara:strand:+ start:134 stop:691 length:558 start_codon:yes stop_codon:yes gene_type:complete
MRVTNILTALLILSLSMSSCKDDCADESCPDGRIRIDDQCECAEGTVDYRGNCEKVAKNSFRIEETSCDCIGSGDLNVQYSPDDLENPAKWNEDGGFYTSEFTFAYNGGGVWSQADYFPENDSLYFWWFSNARFFDCKKNSLATGKFLDNKNKIRLNIYFFEGMEGAGSQNRITDSCTLLLSNGM